MESEKESYEALAERADKQEKRIEALLARVRELGPANVSLRAEAIRQSKRADEERASWFRVHSAMNVLRDDAMRVMRENDATSVYEQLNEVREERDRLLAKLWRFRGVSHRWHGSAAKLRRQLADQEEALEGMRRKVSEAEEQRDSVAKAAGVLVADKDARLRRIEEVASFWRKGKIAALDVVAMIVAEFEDHPAPSANDLERHRAVEFARCMALLKEAASQLQLIEMTLAGAGFPFEGTHIAQVKAMLRQKEKTEDA
jgi:chromosome segregation ATPase